MWKNRAVVENVEAAANDIVSKLNGARSEDGVLLEKSIVEETEGNTFGDDGADKLLRLANVLADDESGIVAPAEEIARVAVDAAEDSDEDGDGSRAALAAQLGDLDVVEKIDIEGEVVESFLAGSCHSDE